jgi:hypothetical protein
MSKNLYIPLRRPKHRAAITLDGVIKISQLVSLVGVAVWALLTYSSFQRENNRLVNEKLKTDLKIAGYEVDAKGQTRFARIVTCKITPIAGSAPNRQFLVEYDLLLKNNSEKQFEVTQNSFIANLGKVSPSEKSGLPAQRQPAVGEPPEAAPKGAITWTEIYHEANKLDFKKASATTQAVADVSHFPFTGRDGTGRLTGGQSLDWSFSFIIRESDAQWVGFSTFLELDNGEKDEDNTWRMDRFLLKEGEVKG